MLVVWIAFQVRREPEELKLHRDRQEAVQGSARSGQPGVALIPAVPYGGLSALIGQRPANAQHRRDSRCDHGHEVAHEMGRPRVMSRARWSSGLSALKYLGHARKSSHAHNSGHHDAQPRRPTTQAVTAQPANVHAASTA
jgi:hypothetical protein